MAGSNQAVNLSGMFGQMQNTLGRRIDTSQFTDAIQNSTRPTLNMEDPQSIDNYARWAESTGKTQEAMALRQRSAQLRQQRNAMERQAEAMKNAMMGQASAQQGDSKGVDTQITNLQQRLKAPGIQPEEQRMIMQQMQQLSSLRPVAVKIETQNKIKGVTQLENLLSNGQLTPEQTAKVQDRMDMLMQDASVATGVNDIKVQQFRQQKELQGMEADKYIAANQARLVAAMDNEDSEALSDIVSGAPPGAQGKVQAMANSYLNLRQTAAKWERQQRDMATPLDIKGAEKTYAELPEAFSKPILGAYGEAAKYQKNNFKNGRWVNEAARTRGLELQSKADSLARALSVQYAQSEAGRSYREQADQDAKVERLQLQLREPISDVEVTRRAQMKQRFKKNGDAIPLTPEDYQNAESELRSERDASIREQLQFITGEKPKSSEGSESLFGDLDPDYAKKALANGIPIERLAKDFGLTVEQVRELTGQEEEMSFIERVRSKLSPMGTYGGRAPSLSDLANGDR